MAAGTAVLASDIPGYRNVARHDVTALMVAPDDQNALRLALRRLLDADDLRGRLVEAASAHVLDFSLARLAERYVGVYEQAIALSS
jgi:phosphatidylinositol alpha-mannosyltransferase